MDLDRVHGPLHGLALGVGDPDPRQLQVHHVAVLQVHDLVGGAGQRQRVGREIVAVGAAADDQRRALARADHAVRLLGAEHGDGVGAFQAAHGLLHGGVQVAVVQVVHQVGDDFGVGLALEHVAGGLQFRAQVVVVLDDAVVHQRDARRALVRAGEMGMRVVRQRRAVGGPAGVGDAGQALDAVLRGLRRQFGDPLGAAHPLQPGARVHGHAAGVVAPVFQPAQAFEQDGNDIVLRHGADDATHRGMLLVREDEGRRRPGWRPIRFCAIVDRTKGNRISIYGLI